MKIQLPVMLKTKSIFKKKRSEVSVCYKINIFYELLLHFAAPPPSPRENAPYILCALYLMFKMLDTIFLKRTFNFVKIILKNPQCNKIHKSIFTEVISLIKVQMYLKHFGRNFAFVKCISLRFDHFKKQIGGLKFLNILCMHAHPQTLALRKIWVGIPSP